MPDDTRRDATNLLTDTPEEAALAIASALCTAKDLLCLCLTCPRFAAKNLFEESGAAGSAAAAAPQRMSIVEEAARRQLAGATEQERGWVPRLGGESLLGLLHELETLRAPLAWTWAGRGGMTGDEGRVACGCEHDPQARQVGVYSCGAIMRSGRHTAEFTFSGVDPDTNHAGYHLEVVLGIDREA